MNEVLLVYVWGIYEQFSWLVGFSFILGVITLFAYGFSYLWENDYSPHYREDEEVKQSFKDKLNYFRDVCKKLLGVSTIILVVNSFIPTRNVAVMMVSAPTIVKLAGDVADSNTTKRLVGILDSSLALLEKKVGEVD